MILNAVMCVWNEEDIIESTVKHALAQGCSNVFIVDNASTDRTIEIALSAGAKLADSFESAFFDEYQKIAHMNTVVRNYNQKSNEEYIWWLYIDADEFPNIDCHFTILDFLKMLDSSVRCVHGYMFNHIPTHPPYHISPYHPADFQPLCTKTDMFKMPLLRYDKNKPHLYSAGGAHTFDTGGESINIVKDILNIHHFHYRRQEHSLRRLKQLLSKRSDGTSRVDWYDKKAQEENKLLTAQSDYHNRYERTKSIYTENRYKSLTAIQNTHSHRDIVRHYNQHELNIPNFSEYDKIFCLAIHYFFLENYDLALCRFNDLLQMTNDSRIYLLLTIKIAQCLAFTDKSESLNILESIIKYQDEEISNYAGIIFKLINEDNILSKRKDVIELNIMSIAKNYNHKIFID